MILVCYLNQGQDVSEEFSLELDGKSSRSDVTDAKCYAAIPLWSPHFVVMVTILQYKNMIICYLSRFQVPISC